MNSTPSSASRATAWLVFAICISDTQPSCMRAPPEAEITISGVRVSSASSAARVIASPTAPLMLPPMNAEVDRGEHDRQAVDRAGAVQRAGLHPGLALRVSDPVRIRLGVANESTSSGSRSPLRSSKLSASSSCDEPLAELAGGSGGCTPGTRRGCASGACGRRTPGSWGSGTTQPRRRGWLSARSANDVSRVQAAIVGEHPAILGQRSAQRRLDLLTRRRRVLARRCTHCASRNAATSVLSPRGSIAAACAASSWARPHRSRLDLDLEQAVERVRLVPGHVVELAQPLERGCAPRRACRSVEAQLGDVERTRGCRREPPRRADAPAPARPRTARTSDTCRRG